MPTNNNRNKNNKNAIFPQQIMISIPRGEGGGGSGTGDVTQSQLTSAISTHNFAPSSHNDIRNLITAKQDILVSGTNIKTINGLSILAGGDVDISADISNAIAYHNNLSTGVHQAIVDKIDLREVLNIELNTAKTEITITYADNSQEVIELNSVNLHADFDSTTNELILLDDSNNEISRVDLSALIPTFSGSTGTHITTSVASGVISATLNSGSVTANELSTALQTAISSIDDKLESSDLANYYTQSEIADMLYGKIDKLTTGTAGNLTAIASNGNLVDTGKTVTDFATAAQGALADTALQTETDPVYLADKDDLAWKTDLTDFVKQTDINTSINTHNTATTNVHQNIVNALNLREVLNVELNTAKTELTITYADNSQEVVDLVNIDLSVDFDSTTNELIIKDENGVEVDRVDLSALIPVFSGHTGTHITTSVSNNVVSATLNSGSVTTNELDSTLQTSIASIANKQATLVSGTNIKTINGESILGSGDIEIQGGGGGDVTLDGDNQFTGDNDFGGELTYGGKEVATQDYADNVFSGLLVEADDETDAITQSASEPNKLFWW